MAGLFHFDNITHPFYVRPKEEKLITVTDIIAFCQSITITNTDIFAVFDDITWSRQEKR
jgi:hypothetical protein